MALDPRLPLQSTCPSSSTLDLCTTRTLNDLCTTHCYYPTLQTARLIKKKPAAAAQQRAMDLDVGAHCGVPSCRLRDWLPFSCDACGGVYCLEHRTYAEHDCPHAHAKQQLAIKCPICKATLQLRGDEDPNAVFEIHSAQGGCDPSMRPKKARCAASKCREVLGPTNTCRCGDCARSFCLRHRFKTDHACEGRPAARGVAGWFSSGPGAAASSAPTPAAARRQPPTAARSSRPSRPASVQRPPAATNTLRGSADRRRQGGAAPGGAYPGQQHRQQAEGVIDLTGDGPPSPPRRAPPQHQQQPGVTVDGGCPFCGVVLADPVALVAHVESAHAEGGGGQQGRYPPAHSSYCHVG